ncbi:MAG: SdrD B-like domain-containing protein [Burkholderiales bacterium]|nr:DUF11 domain-containing protein [Rhodocyclaceae bacterium]MCA3023096.1 DUF11 domain-containing protein [Rhodocyclaceae bacterium]
MKICGIDAVVSRGWLVSRSVFALTMAAALLAVPNITCAQVTVNAVNVQANIGRGQDATVGLDYTRTNVAAATITVPIPATLSINPPTVVAPCTAIAGPAVQCAIPPGALGDTGTINFQVRGASTGSVVLTATATGGSNATSTSNVRTAGDLQVAKTKAAPAGNPIAGQSATFRLTPTINPINGVADDIPIGATVVVTDNLPGTATDFSVSSITASNGAAVACNGASAANTSRTVTCTISGPVLASALGSIDITGVANSVGTFNNAANIASGGIDYIDLNLANNLVNFGYVVEVGSDLRPNGSIFPSGSVQTDSVQTLVVAYNNAGPTNAPTGGMVRAAIPVGFTIGTLPAGCVNSGAGTVNGVTGTVITCTTGAVAVGATQTFNIPLTMPATAGGGNFGVEVSPPVGFGDTNPANNMLLIPYAVAVPFADLRATKTKSGGPLAAGSNIVNTIVLRNEGISPAVYTVGAGANPLFFVDTMSMDEEYVSVSAGWTCSAVDNSPSVGLRRVTCTKVAAGTLNVATNEPAVTLTTRVRAAIITPVTLTNTVCTGATGMIQSGLTGPLPADSVSGNDCDSKSVIGTPVTTGLAQASIIKATSVDGASYGPTSTIGGADNSVYWRMVITTPTTGTNPTQAVIPTLLLTDNIPGLLNVTSPGAPAPSYVTPAISVTTSVTAGAAAGTCPNLPAGSSGSLSCAFTNVAPGTTIEVSFRVDRPFDGGTLSNTGTLTSPDAILTASSGGQLSSVATATVLPRVDIALTTKTLNPTNTATSPRIGQLLEFTVSAQNLGPNNVSGAMTITDNIDPAKYQVLSIAGAVGGTMDCSASNLVTGALSCTTLTTINRYAVRSILITVRPRKVGVLPTGPNDVAYPGETNTAVVSLNTASNCEFKTETVTNGLVSTSCNDASSTSNNSRAVTFDIKVPRFDLQQRKTRVLPGGQTAFGIGDPLRYRFRIQNNGPSRTEKVRVTDVLSVPAGFTLSLASVENVNAVAAEAGYTIDTSKNASVSCAQAAANADVICVLAGVAPDDTSTGNFLDAAREVNFELVLNMSGIAITPVSFGNSARVCGEESVNFESSGACSPIPVVAGNNLASVNDVVFPKTDLTISKTTVTAQSADINQPIRYDLVLKNLGPAATPQMRVADVLPANFEFIATGSNAPSISVGSFVTGSGLTAQNVSCTATPSSITVVGQIQTVSCIANATGGSAAFPGSADVNNTVTVTIFARAKEGFFAGPYTPTNLPNTATVSPGRNTVTDEAFSIDLVSGNDSASSNSRIQSASISGRVFRDRNNNGLQDGTTSTQDEGIGNVTITLTGTDLYGNAVSRTTTTNNAIGATRGDYIFANLPPSNSSGYTLVQSQPAGFINGITNGTPGSGNGGTVGAALNTGQVSSTIPALVLTAGSNAINFDFAEIPPATISGYVYHDRNNNGQKEAGEPGIAGAQMQLVGTDIIGNAVSLSATTDVNGQYTFTVAPSDPTGYTVRQVSQPAGFFDGKEIRGQVAAGEPPVGNVIANSSNSAGAINYTAAGVAPGTTAIPVGTFDVITGVVVAGETNHDNNFGEVLPASISGTVYFDQNNNASKDVSETVGVAGVVMTITGTDLNGNAVSRTVSTDASGNYIFADLLPGTYAVAQGAATNFNNTGSAVQGPNALGLNFQNRSGGSTTTVGNGSSAGGTTSPVVNTIAIGPNGSSQGNNFGVLGSVISGRVCLDEGAGANANNGRCDVGEVGVNNVTVTLTGLASDGVTAVNRSVITDATGAYSFANVPLPNATGYTLTQTQPIGLLDGKQTPGTLTLIQAGPPDAGANAGTASTATNTDTISGIRFTRATNAAGFDFGELRPAVVRGFVYEDNNNNGQREAGEAPIVGVNIRITGTDIFGQAVNQTAGTDTTGEYVFNVPPSDTTGYTVEQVAQPAGYFDGKEIRGQIGAGPPPPANVIPNSSNAAGATGYSAGGVSTGTTNAATDRITGVVVGSNQISQDNSFGELRVAQISGAVFLDQNGNAIRDVGETTGVPGIVITLTGTDLNGNTVTATATSDTSGNYTFANLLPGIYNVTEGPVAAYTNTGAAVQGPQSLSTNFTDRAGVTTTTVSAGSVAGGSTAPVVNSIAIGSGGTSLGNNFGLRPSRLAGRVCIDNGAGGGTINNGRCEAGETGIAGVTVTLSGTAADGTAISLAALTDSVGSYVFSSLKLPNAAGYTLTETQPSAFVDGRQAAGTLTPFAGVDLTPLIGATTNVVGNDAITGIRFSVATNATGYDFGEFRPSSASGFVYADSNNNGVRDVGIDPALPGVTITLTGTDIDGNAISLTTTTDVNGQYTFANLRPGTYRIIETQPPFASQGANNLGTGFATAATNTPLDTFNITVRENETGINFNFGELTTSISGAVYEDLNGNGLRDIGEPGIAGVTIRLTGIDSSGATVDRTTLTNTTGAYSFLGLVTSNPAGYTIREVSQPADYVDGAESIGTVGGVRRGTSNVNDQFTGLVLGPADTAIDYNFGELRLGSIAGSVYVDANGDGIRNPSEAGLAGVVITLTGTSGLAITTTTDAGGNYVFSNLFPDTYDVSETQPPDYGNGATNVGSGGGSPSVNSVTGIVVNSGQNFTGYNFGEVLKEIVLGSVTPRCTRDTLFVDYSISSRGLPLDSPLTITWQKINGEVVRILTNQPYSGSLLWPGTEVDTAGNPTAWPGWQFVDGQWSQIADGLRPEMRVLFQINPTVSGVVSYLPGTPTCAANPPVSFIDGVVYIDTNNNGLQDGGELGIAGVTIVLTGVDTNGKEVAATTTTDAAGRYRFINLSPGVYRVTQTNQPPGTSNGITTPGSTGGQATAVSVLPSSISAVPLSRAQGSTGNNFGELARGTISGRVYVDTNNNGVPDGGELGIAGVTIVLSGTDELGNAVNETTVTDALGNYRFVILRPGIYRLTEPAQPFGTTNGITTPGSSGGTATALSELPSVISAIALAAGQNSINNNFGELARGTISGRVYVDTNNNGVPDGGELGIAGVTIVLSGTDELGNAVNETTVTDALGNYRFVNLRPGIYRLTEPAQPFGTTNGITTPGSSGGTATALSELPSVISAIALAAGQNSINNNFGERPATPDLVVSKTVSSTLFVEGGRYEYQIAVRNAGVDSSQGEYVVYDVLPLTPVPQRFEIEGVPTGTGWTCSVDALVFLTCRSSAVIAPNAINPNRITVRVKVGVGASSFSPLRNAVLVRGGAEPAESDPFGDPLRVVTQQDLRTIVREAPTCPAQANPPVHNACIVETRVEFPVALGGRVWLDGGLTSLGRRIYDPGLDKDFPDWIVEVLDPTLPGGNNIVATVRTGTDGRYLVENLMPGRAYRIQFRDSEGRAIFAGPVNGERRVRQACGGSETGSELGNRQSALDIVMPPGTFPNQVTCAEQSLPIEPNGVVYDSTTRLPVRGAIVTLKPEGACAGYDPQRHVIAYEGYGQYDAAGNPRMAVGPDGFYKFLLSADAPRSCLFRLGVAPPGGYQSPSTRIPAAPTLQTPVGVGSIFYVQPQPTPPTGNQSITYHFVLLGGSGHFEVFNNHIPLDPNAAPMISISKIGDRQVGEIGDSVLYTISVSQWAGPPLSGLQVVDRLPAGFRYIRGTFQLGTTVLPDPQGGEGSVITFNLPNLTAGGTLQFTYRVRIGVGAAEGDGINRAQARSGQTTSNVAQYRIRVTGGVFTKDACVIGKIFVDCNNNHVQDKDELGIPGVRLYFEDGTFLVSDIEGKYSYCGLKPQTHVLKVDNTTLPIGSRLTTTSNRNVGDAGSLFVDLKAGELHRADFAEGSCSNPVLEQVKARRAKGGSATPENERAGGTVLKFESKSMANPKQATDSANQPAVRSQVNAGEGSSPPPAEKPPPVDSSRGRDGK